MNKAPYQLYKSAENIALFEAIRAALEEWGPRPNNTEVIRRALGVYGFQLARERGLTLAQLIERYAKKG